MRAPPERASPETLVVLLRLLPKLPPATMAACPLLPSDAAGDAAAIFQRAHLATYVGSYNGVLLQYWAGW